MGRPKRKGCTGTNDQIECGQCGMCSLVGDILPPSAPEWVCPSCGGVKVGPTGRMCGKCRDVVCSECFERMPSTRFGGWCKVCVADRVLSLEPEVRTITNARSLHIVAGAIAATAAYTVCR